MYKGATKKADLVESEDGDSEEHSEDDSSNENDDNKAENTTALGFMKLLGVDIDTPENDLGDLASSTYAEGPKGIEILAAAASSSSLPATCFVAGFAGVLSSFFASFSSGAASLDSWTTVFKTIVEQAKLERRLLAKAKVKRAETAYSWCFPFTPSYVAQMWPKIAHVTSSDFTHGKAGPYQGNLP